MRRFDYITKTVEVDIDISDILEDLDSEDLEKYHLHADRFCTAAQSEEFEEDFALPLYQAIGALHRQAHGVGPVDACTMVPCRDLSLRVYPELGRA